MQSPLFSAGHVHGIRTVITDKVADFHVAVEHSVPAGSTSAFDTADTAAIIGPTFLCADYAGSAPRRPVWPLPLGLMPLILASVPSAAMVYMLPVPVAGLTVAMEEKEQL